MRAVKKKFLADGWGKDWAGIAADLLNNFTLAEFLEGEEDAELSWLQPVSIDISRLSPWQEKNDEISLAGGFVLTTPEMVLPLDVGQAVYVGHLHANHDGCEHDGFLCLTDAEMWRDAEDSFAPAVEMVHVIALHNRIIFYLHHTCGGCEPFREADDATRMDYIAYLMEVELRL